MTREEALKHVSFIADDAMSFRTPVGWPADAIPAHAVLVGWDDAEVGKPLFVAVKSILPGVTISREDSISLATDGLEEINWSGFAGGAREPDYVL